FSFPPPLPSHFYTLSLHDALPISIVGFSMGAEQAFQWAVSYPNFADRIVATSGTAKCYPHGVVRLEGQIAAITTDAAFQNGDYRSEEHTSELQSRFDLVCRLLLEK